MCNKGLHTCTRNVAHLSLNIIDPEGVLIVMHLELVKFDLKNISYNGT